MTARPLKSSGPHAVARRGIAWELGRGAVLLLRESLGRPSRAALGLLLLVVLFDAWRLGGLRSLMQMPDPPRSAADIPHATDDALVIVDLPPPPPEPPPAQPRPVAPLPRPSEMPRTLVRPSPAPPPVAVTAPTTQGVARPPATREQPRVAEPATPAGGARPAVSAAPAAAPAPNTALQLYTNDGRLKVPETMMDDIDARFGEQRAFDYQIPNLATAGTFFDRPPPFTYESTRFEGYWKPNQDLLSDLLSTAIAATTQEIRIPIRGSGKTIVCKVSILQAGGGCGIEGHANDAVALDDPNTLNPEEDKACQALWDIFATATLQDAMLKARREYDAQCRKPRERADVRPLRQLQDTPK